ncbi:hypothetical protein BW462_07425 [Salmonella enterica]|nr:hypothetical protein [Salmonella enterica]
MQRWIQRHRCFSDLRLRVEYATKHCRMAASMPYPVYGPCGCRPDKRRVIRHPGSMMAGK